MFKKILYSFIIFIVVLLVAIVVAANSSFVIKKAVDMFAPDYKISYDNIKGNIFTGVTMSGLKYDKKNMIKSIKFSWNPSKILYKTVAINEISVDNLDVDIVKLFIASLPKGKENNTSSEPLPVRIVLDKVHLSVNPFEEQGIFISNTVLNLKNIVYSNDDINVDKIHSKIDTSIVDIELDASLDSGMLEIQNLSLRELDSQSIEKMFLTKDTNNEEKNQKITEKSTEKTSINPLIPVKVEVKHFITTLKPRSYKKATVDKLALVIQKIDADIPKLIENRKNALKIGNYTLDFKSNMGQIDIAGNLKNSTVTLNHINISKLDTLALQSMFASDNNTSSKKVNKQESKVEQASTTKKSNNLIPEHIIVKLLHTDIFPSTYNPVNVLDLSLDAKDIDFNIQTLTAQKGTVNLNGKTNLINFSHQSNIKNNKLKGDFILSPKKELFETYKLPIRQKAIDDIKIDFTASEEEVVANLHTKAKQILITASDSNKTDTNSSKKNKKIFNVDIDNLTSKVIYKLKENILKADTSIFMSTPYAKNISITNTFNMDSNISYSGAVKVNKILGIDAKLTKAVNNLNITYTGDLKHVNTNIDSDGLTGSLVSSDLKKGIFHLQTKSAMEVGKMVSLPAELNATKVNVVLDVPIDFMKPLPIHGKAAITSNVANIDAKFSYDKDANVALKFIVPKHSLLKNFDKNIQWSAISPLKLNAKINNELIKVNLKSSKIDADLAMKPSTYTVDGKVKLAGLLTTVNAQKNGSMVIKSNVNSMKSLFTTINQFYKVKDMPKVDGKLNIALIVDKKSDISLHLASPKIVYHADRKTDHEVENIKLVLSTQKTKVILKSYQLNYNKMKIFATKPSIVDFQKENIHIAQLWLNDQLHVEGNYNTKTKKGTILTDASKFHLAHKIIDLDSAIKVKTKLDGVNTAITGTVTLLGGDVHYDLDTKSFPSDSDILIVQDIKKKEVSPFMDNLSTEIKVNTKKPIVYKQGSIDVKANVNLSLHKDKHADLMVLGSVELPQGGSYIFQDKKFVLDKSFIHFIGDPQKPLLEISIKYKSVNYLVTILVTGSPSAPNIAFSSVPSLSKEQILSVILFDSIESSGGGDAGDMMKMMGGMMAKSALSDFGVKIDHLVVGAGGSVEVGKKLTDKITIIYVNDEISSVQLKYDHSQHTQSVLSTSQRSSSYDIMYRGDF